MRKNPVLPETLRAGKPDSGYGISIGLVEIGRKWDSEGKTLAFLKDVKHNRIET